MRHLTRALSALTAAAAIALAAVPPAGADHQATPKPKAAAAAVDYGSGAWGGPLGTPATTGDLNTAGVALYGDSIANRCTADIRTRLALDGRTLYTYTWSGQNTEGLVDALTAATRQPPIVIMEAGTNDAFQPPLFAAQIDRAKVFMAGTDAELYWVDTWVARTGLPAAVQLHDARNSGWVNNQIHGAIAADHIVQWNAQLGYAVGRGRALGYYLQDGVHPWIDAGTGHGDGCAFLASIIAAALPTP